MLPLANGTLRMPDHPLLPPHNRHPNPCPCNLPGSAQPTPPAPTNTLVGTEHVLPTHRRPPLQSCRPSRRPLRVPPGPPTLAMSQTVTSGLRGTRSKE